MTERGIFQVVIADDEPLIVHGMKKLISWQEADAEIIGTAESGEGLLALIRDQHPDIVITDIAMPGMDGLSVLRQLKESGDKTKVILLSAYQKFDYAREALKLGAFDYLVKPVGEEELLDVLFRVENAIRKDAFPIRKAVDNAQPDDTGKTGAGGAHPVRDVVRQAKEYIEENYASECTLEQVAGFVYMNPYYFSSLFKKETGQNYKSYLLSVRMKVAMNLLQETDLQVRQLAHAVGYKDIRTFTDNFRMFFGKNPSCYRKR